MLTGRKRKRWKQPDSFVLTKNGAAAPFLFIGRQSSDAICTRFGLILLRRHTKPPAAWPDESQLTAPRPQHYAWLRPDDLVPPAL